MQQGLRQQQGAPTPCCAGCATPPAVPAAAPELTGSGGSSSGVVGRLAGATGDHALEVALGPGAGHSGDGDSSNRGARNQALVVWWGTGKRGGVGWGDLGLGGRMQLTWDG